MQRQHLGGPQKAIIFQALGEGRHELTFRRDIRRTFQFLLDAVGERHFLGVHLQAGELLVGLADHFLQILVTCSKAIGFPPKGIIVGHFPGHAGIAGNHSEH